jgi:hypothetical protein
MVNIMASGELSYDVVWRGETITYIREGRWVFFQRLKEYGGGYWLGRTYHDAFIFGLERPTPLLKVSLSFSRWRWPKVALLHLMTISS